MPSACPGRDALRAVADRLPAHRRRAHRALQLALRPPHRRALPAAHRGHRPGALDARRRPRRSSRGCAGSASTGTARRSASSSAPPRHAEVAHAMIARGTAYRCYRDRRGDRGLPRAGARPRAARRSSARPGATPIRRPRRDAPLRRAPARAARRRDRGRGRGAGHGHLEERDPRRPDPAALRRHAHLHARRRRRRPRHGRDPRHPRRRPPDQRRPADADLPRDGLGGAGHGPHPADPRRRTAPSSPSGTARSGSTPTATWAILPEAMRNYLARLGWSHGNDEFFTTEQAIAWFDLDPSRQGAGAIRLRQAREPLRPAHPRRRRRGAARRGRGLSCGAKWPPLDRSRARRRCCARCRGSRSGRRPSRKSLIWLSFILGKRPFRPDAAAAKVLAVGTRRYAGEFDFAPARC